jgi:LmbE family N-acetylglucosaminyl deacetylase
MIYLLDAIVGYNKGMKQMLCVFAHPDDESFSCGLTIPKYVSDGWTVTLIVATPGQKGSVGPLGDMAWDDLALVRIDEVKEAAKILGIKEVIVLPYSDGALKELPSGEFEDVLYKKMVELSPDIVITHDTTGISNHPDHIRVCFSTTYAFQKYAKEIMETRQFIADVENREPDIKKRHFVSRHNFALRQERFAEIVETDMTPKLYYTCIPRSAVHYMQEKEIFPMESFGKPMMGTPDKFVTTVIEGKEEKLTKLKALAKHKSQSEDVDRFYEDESNPTIIREFFILRMHGINEVFMGKNDTMSDHL